MLWAGEAACHRHLEQRHLGLGHLRVEFGEGVNAPVMNRRPAPVEQPCVRKQERACI